MNTAERIYDEAKRLPEEIAEEVLDFILFLEQRLVSRRDPSQHRENPETMRSLAKMVKDGEIGGGSMADLLAHPYPPKGDGLPMKREELYDRACLR